MVAVHVSFSFCSKKERYGAGVCEEKYTRYEIKNHIQTHDDNASRQKKTNNTHTHKVYSDAWELSFLSNYILS